MATVTVAVLGMGRIGASIGLALRRYNERKDAQHKFEVTYADTRPGVREDAKSIGITDRIDRDPFNAARGKDIVIMALPYADAQIAYKNIGPELRPGAVVLDAAPLKQPSLEWASTYLSKEAHVVGITPVINPKYLFDGLDDTLHAAADLFDDGAMLLMPSVTCIKDAVELAADFSTILGAKPHFADPAEHDSLVALTEGLPALLGAAAFYMTIRGQTWNDAQRVTNASFGRLTHHLHDTHPDDLRDALLNNRVSLVHQLDQFIATLSDFRGILAQNDRAALEAALIASSDAYSAWINRRHNARWDEGKADINTPSVSGMLMTGLMGNFLSRRLGGKNGDEKK